MVIFASGIKLQTLTLVACLCSLFIDGGEAVPRNPKKGLSMHTAQSCLALQPHVTASWWYSWSTSNGFSGRKGSFCDEPEISADDARNRGLEFVPMFWGANIPARPYDAETEKNFQLAKYLLTFNEPELIEQSNVLPAKAAELWPTLEAIASEYNLELVAPCTTGDKGIKWYQQWLGNCTSLNNSPCNFDYTCTHLYYQPWNDTLGSCSPGVFDWSCVGKDASKAANRIAEWHSIFGKPMWVTEFACAPWGGAGCDKAKHTELLKQMLPVLHDNPTVFRYAWYTTFDGTWVDNSLNQLTWEDHRAVTCPNSKWLKGYGPESWKIQSLHECVSLADLDGQCRKPLSLNVDDDGCYCAKDSCSNMTQSYNAMTTYKEVGPRNTDVLTALGVYYDEFGTAAPSQFPTSAPTAAPSQFPTSSPTQSPSAVPVSVQVPVGRPSEPFMEFLLVQSVSNAWITVQLTKTYSSAVPVCSAQMDQGIGMDAGVIRISNIGVSTFDIKIQSTAKAGGSVMARDVHCLIVEKGAWLLPDGRKIEAQTFMSTQTSSKGSWTAANVSYMNSYSQTIVLGQVISTNDPKYSLFWVQGTGDRKSYPSPYGLKVGKHIGEDISGIRADEILGFIVIESGHASTGGYEMEAGRSSTIAYGYVQGLREYKFLQKFQAAPAVMVVSQVGQRGNDGSWAVTKGAPASDRFRPAVDEDVFGDPEREHSSEAMDYIAVSIQGSIPLKPV